jgi:hypothetical protein
MALSQQSHPDAVIALWPTWGRLTAVTRPFNGLMLLAFTGTRLADGAAKASKAMGRPTCIAILANTSQAKPSFA